MWRRCGKRLHAIANSGEAHPSSGRIEERPGVTQIPSDIPASAAQAGFQSNEVAKEREARRAGAAHATNRQIKSVDEAGAVVDTEDADVAIFAEAEGGGSQGRETAEAPESEASEESAAPQGGITKDDEGQSHVDMEA